MKLSMQSCHLVISRAGEFATGTEEMWLGHSICGEAVLCGRSGGKGKHHGGTKGADAQIWAPDSVSGRTLPWLKSSIWPNTSAQIEPGCDEKTLCA